MRMLIRSIPVVALALTMGAAHLPAQQPGNGNFQWYVGGQGGVTFFKTQTQGNTGIPAFGGHALIVARRTGLLLSVDEAVGDGETSTYTDVVTGTQTATFNDIRKYSAVLMAFPVRSAVQPYLGIGYGIVHAVNPQTTGAFPSDAADLGSSGFATFVGGVQFQVGRLMAFGQYQITSSPGTGRVVDDDGNVVAFGRLLVGPTHTFSGGVRIGLGGSRENVSAGGY